MRIHVHTHTFRHHVPYTSTYKLIPLRLVKSMDPCASVPITHRHKGRPKRIGNASPHSTKQKFPILHLLSLPPLWHTPYSPHPLRSTPTRAPTHICGVLTSLPRPVEGEEQPLTPEHGRWMQHFCSLIQKQHTLRDRLTRDVDCQYCLLLELRVLLDHKLPLLQSSVHEHQHVGPNQC